MIHLPTLRAEHSRSDGGTCAARAEHGYDVAWPCQVRELADRAASAEAALDEVEALAQRWSSSPGDKARASAAQVLRAAARRGAARA